jgi:hypothetical protein
VVKFQYLHQPLRFTPNPLRIAPAIRSTARHP